MASELVIAKSLAHAPLKVEIQNAPKGVTCKDSKGSFGTEFILKNNLDGSYDWVSCSLEDMKKEIPSFASISVNYSIINDQYQIPESEFVTKRQLLEFQSILTQKKKWTPELVEFAKNHVPEISRVFRLEKNHGIMVAKVQNDFTFIQVTGYSGQITEKRFFRDREFTVSGQKSSKKSIYPKYNKYALVCGSGSKDRGIEGSFFGGGELYQNIALNEEIICKFNIDKDEKIDEKDFSGDIYVSLKSASHGQILELIKSNIAVEESQLENRLTNLYNAELASLLSNVNEINRTVYLLNLTYESIKKKVEQQKYNAFKEKLFASLLKDKVIAKISRSASTILLTPVKKIVFDENGDQHGILYLNLTNKISYKIDFEGSNAKFDRDLPFEEKVNLYLATNEKFDSQKPETLLICNGRIEAFYQNLSDLQDRMNDDLMSYASIRDALKRFSTPSVSNCSGDNKDSSDVEFSRGLGKDYIVVFSPTNDSDPVTLKPIGYGAKYYYDFLSTKMNQVITKAPNSMHPIFSNNFTLQMNKSLIQSSFDPALDGYVFYYTEDEFAKLGSN